MSEHDDTDTPEDDALQRRLRADMPKTSEAHDRSILAAAREFTSEPTPERPTTVETLQVPTPVPSDRTPGWAMAAAILATAGIGAMVLLSSAPPNDTTRGADSDVLPLNGAELTDAPNRFVLPEAAHALGCRLTLRDESGVSIWVSDAFSGGQIDVSASVREQIQTGGFTWQANCQGIGSQSFGPYRFKLTP